MESLTTQMLLSTSCTMAGHIICLPVYLIGHIDIPDECMSPSHMTQPCNAGMCTHMNALDSHTCTCIMLHDCMYTRGNYITLDGVYTSYSCLCLCVCVCVLRLCMLTCVCVCVCVCVCEGAQQTTRLNAMHRYHWVIPHDWSCKGKGQLACT